MNWVVFSDFDGTITLRDSNDALVDRYIGAEKRATYDRLFLDGGGVLWEVLDTSLQACGVPLPEALSFLQEAVAIDPGFVGFHDWCRDREIPLSVLSAGLHEVVECFLLQAGLALPIRANRASCFENRFGLTPADAGCPTGVDKAAVIQEARAAGHYTIFIGDGFSDRLAAPHADLVYAKSALARFCDKRGIPYVPFEGFAEIQADLARRLKGL
jgi:2,3-diketo-5-methylthio-1-phosphopentane phosphatase